jgi:hypothetical protein
MEEPRDELEGAGAGRFRRFLNAGRAEALLTSTYGSTRDYFKTEQYLYQANPPCWDGPAVCRTRFSDGVVDLLTDALLVAGFGGGLSGRYFGVLDDRCEGLDNLGSIRLSDTDRARGLTDCDLAARTRSTTLHFDFFALHEVQAPTLVESGFRMVQHMSSRMQRSQGGSLS